MPSDKLGYKSPDTGVWVDRSKRPDVAKRRATKPPWETQTHKRFVRRRLRATRHRNGLKG
ncbi:hypothetical protein LCGC14_3010710 [marine sediment metagenome]|uniref:Uncharacterized protein n=1 Tax=marine sediment metagenome TaxID=412755 RepID=A0A0F8WY57_9ZZZZ